MEVEPLIDDAFRPAPDQPIPVPSQRPLKTIAFLDTECDGIGAERRMTELAIISVAYDGDQDEVIGILQEYPRQTGQPLDKTTARSARKGEFHRRA